MEITGIDQHHLVYELDGTWSPSWIPGVESATHEVDLFAVHTDEDLTGYTAFPSFPGGGVHFADGLETILRGEDPREIERILDLLETIDFLGVEAWFLELAMWDLIGKQAGLPVYRLLGGSPDPIPVYASTGAQQSTEDRLEYVEDRVNDGYEAVKLRFAGADPEAERNLPQARYIREEFPDLVIMVDANMGWSMRLGDTEPAQWSGPTAQYVARELEDLHPIGWLEEPLGMHEYERLAELRSGTTIPIAGGESVNGVVPLREYVTHGAVDILQPDALFATGIRRGKAVADMAAMHGLEFAPHTWSNGLGLAANLHLMAVTDCRWCEYPLEPPAWDPNARDFFLSEPLLPSDGRIEPPNGPGLGVEIDWDAVETAEEHLPRQ